MWISKERISMATSLLLFTFVTLKCNANTIIASDSQYREGTITCHPSEDCTVICNNYRSCYKTEIQCPSNNSCTVQCTAPELIRDAYTCADATIICPINGQCDVICDGRSSEGYGYSCKETKINWPSRHPHIHSVNHTH